MLEKSNCDDVHKCITREVIRVFKWKLKISAKLADKFMLHSGIFRFPLPIQNNFNLLMCSTYIIAARSKLRCNIYLRAYASPSRSQCDLSVAMWLVEN